MMSCSRLASCAIVLLSYTLLATSQSLPSTFPHSYPNKPTGAYGPTWQKYFEVTAKLPNVTFPIARSFAGNLPVNRAGHDNNTLFFVGFEKSKGSLTVPLGRTNTDPWGIWLNGGPGSSSLLGMLFENGPISIKGDYSAGPNPYSWNKLADYFWIDQPVGVGYATSDSTGYAVDEDQVGKDFMGFLSNLVKVFPSLATRPLHLTGESYAGQYIPYILKAYFDMPNPPVKIAKIAMGNGAYTTEQVFELLPALSVLETYPQIIGYDQEVYKYFKQQTHLCKFDVNLTYPQNGMIADIPMVFPSERDFGFKMKQRRLSSKTFLKELKRRSDEQPVGSLMKREDRDAKRDLYKRDLSMRPNGTIDPWYGCFLLDMFIDYALNYTFPWTLTDQPGFPFNVYNIPDALNPKIAQDASVWLNDPRTRAALHAPTVKDWEMNFDFTFGENGSNDPSPVAITIFNALAANATARNVDIVLYSGNDDSLIPHRGTEIAIQNTTFGGIQGFTRKPATPWYNDALKLAGVVHQERGWSYVLFLNSGHLVPTDAPLSAYTFLREFVLGNNKTGLVTKILNKVVVLGGEVASLMGNIPGPDPIYYGNGATQSSYIFPKATRTAWKAFIAKETAAPKKKN